VPANQTITQNTPTSSTSFSTIVGIVIPANHLKEDVASQHIAEISGVGLLTAMAAVATIGDAKAFKSGREIAAWLGLVPRQTGTGGRIRILGHGNRLRSRRKLLGKSVYSQYDM